MFAPIFQRLKASADVKAIVGTNPPRIYAHGKAPQRPDKLPLADPYITWFVFGAPENSLEPLARVDRDTVHVDCWALDERTVRRLALAARAALEPFGHCIGIPVDGQEPETKLYRIGLQFDYWQDTAAA